MNTQKTLRHKIMSAASILLLIFLVGGCGSTDSDSDDNSNVFFDSGLMGPGETYSYTFEDEGTFEYFCEVHTPDMQAEITVASDAEISGQDTVEMRDLQFQPAQLTVSPNTEIVWVNRDSVDHTVTSGNPSSNGDGGGY